MTPPDPSSPSSGNGPDEQDATARREPGAGPAPGGAWTKLLEHLSARTSKSSRYRHQGEIARGGMGSIVRVWDTDLHRHLAMKIVLKPDDGEEERSHLDDRKLGQFLNEAQVTGQLDHPGVVPVHDIGVDETGRAFFTMQLVKGNDLAEVFDWVRSGVEGWTQTRALNVLLKACEALAYAHSRDVVHRDLKPGNIMVGRFGEVYVMDWGLARVMGKEHHADLRPAGRAAASAPSLITSRHDAVESEADSPLVTREGDVVGTPAYMSPEQANGEVELVDARSDVYSMGAILYALLTGHMPYLATGEQASSYVVLCQVREGAPRSVHAESPDAPAELHAICEKAMARVREHRYANVDELADDLRAYLEGRVVRAYRTGAVFELKKWVQRNKPLAAALCAVFVVLVVGLVSAELLREKASEQARVATERAEDVLRLSALQDLEDLLDDAGSLWPAHPENIEGCRAWIARAEELVGELPRHRARREELRAAAIPLDEAQRQAQRESHPDLPRLVRLQGETEARRRALLQRRDEIAAELPVVDWSRHVSGASALNAEAWPLVDPDRVTFGREPLGLVLAQRALEVAGDDPILRATVTVTLAWAYFAMGRDSDAHAAGAAARASAEMTGLDDFDASLAQLEESIAAACTVDALAAADREFGRLQSEVAGLEAGLDERQEWRFLPEHGEARWWNAQLSKLIEGLEALRDEQTGLLAANSVSSGHGWSVARRLSFAEHLEAGFAPGGGYAERWDASLPHILAAYPDLDLGPQMGLVPIGPDPGSGLWEFWHVATGDEPQRDERGELVLTEETGVVLVLLPGGGSWMGAQKHNPAGRNYDPDAQRDEGPVHAVSLPAFFLSKYELTQGQWARLTGENPSYYQDTQLAPTLLHPVEQVTWVDCMTWLPRNGLSLPGEAHWEYACRAGTDTVWWTGSERESLRVEHAANLADQAAARARAPWAAIETWPELDDGYAVHAPVGSFAPQALGLHEVHGNVWEWCLEGYHPTSYSWGEGPDSPSPLSEASSRVARGGSFSNAAISARSASRNDFTPNYAASTLGVRPARFIAD